jgi:hypothetical protein
MNLETKLIKSKLGLLGLAEELGKEIRKSFLPFHFLIRFLII